MQSILGRTCPDIHLDMQFPCWLAIDRSSSLNKPVANIMADRANMFMVERVWQENREYRHSSHLSQVLVVIFLNYLPHDGARDADPTGVSVMVLHP